MSNSQPVLYTYWRSSCSWRVRIVLNLKDIPHQLRPVALDEEEQFTDEYLKINPIGQVPVLRIDGHNIIESLAIIDYLEETYTQKPLLPQDVYKRAQVRGISEIITSGIQPLQNTSTLNYLGEERKLEWAQYWVKRGFKAIEKLLETSAGKYCVGDEITLADCCLVPQVYNATQRFQIDLASYPTIARINKALENHPAFLAAHPSNQSDCPPDEREL